MTRAQVLSHCYMDGRVPISTDTAYSTPASGTTTGSGGGGGSLSGSGCPADYQVIETKERGLIRADEVDVGMHFRAPINSGLDWVRVNDAARKPTMLWRFTVENEDGVSESFDVNDTHACKALDGSWLLVSEAAPGVELLGGTKRVFLTEAHEIGAGHFIAFDVDTHEFTMGGVCAHNFVTY